MSKLLTIPQVAAHLQVTKMCIHNWIKDGRLPSTKFGRCRRILESDLEQFVIQGRTDAAAPAKAA